MAEPHLDHPCDVVWYAGVAALKPIGPCPHTACPHDLTSVVAEGPDYDHYTLSRCDVADGCAGACRGWWGEYPPEQDHGPRYHQFPFMAVSS